MSQATRLLKYLKSGKTLTRIKAWDTLGILETPARISELRQSGHTITTEMVPVVNRYGETVRIAKWRLVK